MVRRLLAPLVRPARRFAAATVLGALVATFAFAWGSTRTATPHAGSQASAAAQPAPVDPQGDSSRFTEIEWRVQGSDYAGAAVVAMSFPPADRARIMNKVSRHLARRVVLTLRTGDRMAAHALLAGAEGYPETPELRRARARYRAAARQAARARGGR